MTPQDPVIEPDLEDILNTWQNTVFANINCVQIGKIEKVNDNQTCEIKIQVKRRIPNDKTASYPLLVDCPYVVLSGGKSYIDLPIQKGDKCLILFNDRNIDDWWDTENVKEPRDRRKHSLSDGIALVGIGSKNNNFTMDGDFVRIIGKSGPGQEKEAARKDDQTLVNSTTDNIFITWITTISAAVNALAPGSVPVVPTTVTGKISTASSEVKIG